MQDQCPHAMQIGSQQSKISSLEKEIAELRQSSRIADLEERIADLEETARSSASLLLQDKARQAGFLTGMHMTVMLVGYSFVILALLVAGKFTGALDLIIKFITSSILK